MLGNTGGVELNTTSLTGKMYQPYEGQCYGGYGYQYRTYACDDGFDLADDTSSYVTCRNGYVDNSRFPV